MCVHLYMHTHQLTRLQCTHVVEYARETYSRTLLCQLTVAYFPLAELPSPLQGTSTSFVTTRVTWHACDPQLAYGTSAQLLWEFVSTSHSQWAELGHKVRGMWTHICTLCMHVAKIHDIVHVHVHVSRDVGWCASLEKIHVGIISALMK